MLRKHLVRLVPVVLFTFCDLLPLQAGTASWITAVVPLAPRTGTATVGGALSFRWQCHDEGVSRWDLLIVRAVTGDTVATVPLLHVSEQNGQYTQVLSSMGRLLRERGVYRWAIRGHVSEGQVWQSPFRSLIYRHKNLDTYFDGDSTKYELKWKGVQRNGNGQFSLFKNSLSNNRPFQGYAEMEMIFNQRWGRRLQSREQLILTTGLGLGGGIDLQYKLFATRFLVFKPYAGIQMTWRSEGLKQYAGTSTRWHAGGELAIMPGGYLTFKMAYVPDYHIRYINISDNLRTFQGEGWEAGFRLVLSRKIISPIPFFGWAMDLKKMPIEYTVCRVKDSYTGTRMKEVRISVGYMF